MRFLLLLTVFLITYGSLYPFSFDFGSVDGDRIGKLLNFKFYDNSYLDIISNVILFVPLGFLLAKVFSSFRSKSLQFFTLNLVGFLIAYVIQVFQLWTPERVPNGGDALWNLLGCIIGMLLAKAHQDSKRFSNNTIDGNSLVYLILGAALILLNWSPFVPSLDFDTVKNNLKVLLFAPVVNYFWVFEKLILWLVSFYFLAKSNVFRMRVSDILALVFTVLVVKIFIMDSPLNINHILGAISACIVWFMFETKLSDRFISILLVLVVVGLSFYPFELRESVGTFKWLPFSGSLNGNILINILAMTKKSIFYACLVWSVYRASKNLITSTTLVAILVFICEYLQIFLVQSVAEITDAMLVLVAGYSLHVLMNSNKSITDQQSQSLPIKAPQVDSVKVEPPIGSLVQKSLPIIGLDGLRAIAALSVFMVHFYQQISIQISVGVFDLNLWMFNGNTGVALFFVLSGFLLSQPFWQAKVNNSEFPNIKQYFLRRAARILPAYYFCLIAIIIGKFVFGGTLNFNNLISHFFFLHNLKDYQVLSLNPPFWTLAVEVQFYLLLPLFFIFLKRFSFSTALFIFVLAVPTFYGFYVLIMKTLIAINDWPITIPLLWPFGILFESGTGAALKYATTAHLPHFLLGVVTSALFIQKVSKPNKPNIWLGIIFWAASVGVFVILSTPLDGLLQIEYGRYNFPYVPVLLALIVFTTPFTMFGKYILEQPIMLWIGRLSYGIYLYHYLVLKGVGRLFKSWDLVIDDNQLLYGFASFIITIFVAFLSFQLLEKPILNLVKKTRKNNNELTSVIQITISESVNASGNSAQTHGLTENTKPPYKKGVVIVAIFAISAMLSILAVYYSQQPQRVIKQASWANDPASTLIFDHHTHTDFSNGELGLETMVELAYFSGCDAVAITDHSGVSNSSPVEKFERIEALRAKYSELKIFGGLELGMSSYDDREHVSVLVHPAIEKQIIPELISTLKQMKGQSSKNVDQATLTVLDKFRVQKNNVIAIYNHPSRKDSNKFENVTNIKKWNATSNNITSFSGAPGHQKKSEIGSDAQKIKTIDRWDPAVAEIGGAWDKLLSEGHNIWGAIASSDFHNEAMDEDPCGFARTHVLVPENSYSGILQGLKAGTFWADHGKILKKFDMQIRIDNSEKKATSGAIVIAKKNSLAEITINIERDIGSKDSPLFVELISNCRSGDSEIYENKLFDLGARSLFVLLPLLNTGSDKQSCFVRTRVRKMNLLEPDLMAYGNPIRFILD